MALARFNLHNTLSGYSWAHIQPFSEKQFFLTGENELFPDPDDTDDTDGTDYIDARIICRGDFKYYLDEDGNTSHLYYGTINSFSLYVGGSLDINISGIALDISDFNSLILAYDWNKFFRYTLKSNDIVYGSPFDDTLDGGIGSDTIYGGDGNDVYIIDNIGDVIVEYSDVDSGYDTARSSVSYTLPTNVESLTLTGTSNITGTGNASDNILTGNTGNNVLTGGAGNDSLIGGSGNDTLRGETGNDVYFLDSTGDRIFETSTVVTEIDEVQSSVTCTLGSNLEILTLTGSNIINGTGNVLSNTITGNSASNVLSGGGGNDTITGGDGNDSLYGGVGNDSLDGGTGSNFLVGGAGNDTYIVRNAADVIIEQNSSGTETDIIFSYVDWTLGQNLENLTLLDTAKKGSGNSRNNGIIGNDNNNLLFGGWGNDSLIGSSGNDSLYGGLGNDALTGGTDLDNFLFTTPLASSNIDTITDFTPGMDKIVLDNDIFTTLTKTGTLASNLFRKGAAAVDADDRIIFNTATGALYYDADGNGAGVAVQFALVRGTAISAITNTDFLVIA